MLDKHVYIDIIKCYFFTQQIHGLLKRQPIFLFFIQTASRIEVVFMKQSQLITPKSKLANYNTSPKVELRKQAGKVEGREEREEEEKYFSSQIIVYQQYVRAFIIEQQRWARKQRAGVVQAGGVRTTSLSSKHFQLGCTSERNSRCGCVRTLIATQIIFPNLYQFSIEITNFILQLSYQNNNKDFMSKILRDFLESICKKLKKTRLKKAKSQELFMFPPGNSLLIAYIQFQLVPKQSSNNNYCAVCQQIFEDYLDHIHDESHKSKVNRSKITTYIKELQGKYKKMTNEESIQNEALKIEVCDDSSNQFIMSKEGLPERSEVQTKNQFASQFN